MSSMAFTVLAGCAERYPDTPKLQEARALEAAGTQRATGGRTRTAGPPAELARALKGGRKVFEDQFDRVDFGPNWKIETPDWRIEAGEVHNRQADNAGAWLLEKLPDGDVRIEYDARSMPFVQEVKGKKQETFPGDMKCEAWNTEPTHQRGYVFIFGGWNNRVNRIARIEEHGNGPGAWVQDGPPRPVEAGHVYRMKIIRVGKTVAFYADDQYLGHATDADFIEGRYFGFNNWRSHLIFDNLAVYLLSGAPEAAPKTPPAPQEPAPNNPGN
jgi:hypothetical protein